YRLIDLVGALDRPIEVRVRPHLRGVHDADEAAAVRGTPAKVSDDRLLLVNARLAPSAAVLAKLVEVLEAARPGWIEGEQGIAVALLPAGAAAPPLEGKTLELQTYLAALGIPRFELDLPLFAYPHDVIRHHLLSLAANLEHRLRSGNYHE